MLVSDMLVLSLQVCEVNKIVNNALGLISNSPNPIMNHRSCLITILTALTVETVNTVFHLIFCTPILKFTHL